MDFETFFAKKKIDLAKFKLHDQELLAKLRSDFERMNERSFDHYYKYLFNTIRKHSLLEE